jgi:hypothetical protein
MTQKKSLFDLIDKVGKADKALTSGDIFAPVAPNSRIIRTRVADMVREFNIPRQKTAGLRIFQATDTTHARYVREANPDETRQYLDMLPKVYFILVYRGEDHWYGFPANQDAFAKKMGDPTLVIVHNADNVDQFDHVITRFDGACFWFDDLDNRVDPIKTMDLRDALKARDWSRVSKTDIDNPKTYAVEVKGVTPEDMIAYQLAARRVIQETRSSLETRLETDLKDVGAKLDGYTERGDNVEVRWVNASGQGYTTVIRKDDFKVVTAGICVSGEDRKFNLKSLVGVVNHAEQQRRVGWIGHGGGLNERQYFDVHPEPRELGDRGRDRGHGDDEDEDW